MIPKKQRSASQWHMKDVPLGLMMSVKEMLLKHTIIS
jgi:hypothetical protein